MNKLVKITISVDKIVINLTFLEINYLSFYRIHVFIVKKVVRTQPRAIKIAITFQTKNILRIPKLFFD